MGIITDSDVLKIQNEQGWSDEEVMRMALDFVEGNSKKNFTAYLREIAERENEGHDGTA